jgi:hypothetical protein
MGLSPDALYSAIYADVKADLPQGPVVPSKLPPDVSYRHFASASLLYDVTRKWVPEDSSAADAVAREKFLASNKTCRDWKLELTVEKDKLLFGEFQRQLDLFLHPEGNLLYSSYFDILSNGRTGPGSSLGARGNSFYAKLSSSKLTATSLYLYEMYRNYTKLFLLLDEAEVHRHQVYGGALVVKGSRCSFVPKTQDVSRMICVEPSVNMFCQLGLGALLEQRLKDLFNLDLAVQPSRNRLLAQVGSKTGSFATIDLSSASDSISLKLCETVLPGWFFQTLLELRSPSTSIDGVTVPLNMISTMGNGFTFPLQTLLFSCLIRAAYRVEGVSLRDGREFNWACFGDDLVVDTQCADSVLRLLNILGFTPNSSKTFLEGPFRESCGADWLNGRPVRSVFIKRLRSPQDIFVAVNLLNTWSAYTGIPLINGINYLLSGLRTSPTKFYVPFDENNDSGIRVPSTAITWRPKRDMNLSILYKRFIPSPKVIRIGEGNIHCPRGIRKLIYNPAGLLNSFLLGELVGCKIAVRHDRIHYNHKLRCTPYWDYMPSDSLNNGYRLSWQQWETAVLINLSNP